MRGLMVTILFSSLVTGASAQVVNGDFESGTTGWTLYGAGCAAVLPTGGNPNGCAQILWTSSTAACDGAIEQTFNCGSPGGTCQVSFDYRMDLLTGFGATFFGVTIDAGVSYLYSTSSHGLGWQQVTVTMPCGMQTLRFAYAAGTTF